MPITAVLLDAGGVILDERESEEIKAELISDVLNAEVPGYSVMRYLLDIEEAIRSFCPDVYRYVLWKYSAGDVRRFERLFTSIVSAWNMKRPDLKLMGGLGEAVSSISSEFEVGIAGQYGREVLDALDDASLTRYFAHLYTQDDFAITKPDPRYLEQIARACGHEPMNCIMVGDRIDKDVIPAKQVGMGTILIRVGLHRNQKPRIPSEIPDMELDTIEGLATAVKELAYRRN